MSEYAYVARHICGYIVAASVDVPATRKQLARDVAGWIKQGETVERLSIEEVRAAKWCQCFRKRAETDAADAQRSAR